MHHIRRIPAEELPRVRDQVTGDLRAPTERELLNFGLMPIGEELYDCAHVDGDPEPEWGERVVQGAERYERMPERIRRGLTAENRWRGEF